MRLVHWFVKSHLMFFFWLTLALADWITSGVYAQHGDLGWSIFYLFVGVGCGLIMMGEYRAWEKDNCKDS